MTELARTFLTSLVVSLLLVWLCRFLALRYGFVAKPRRDRWYAKPTALMGGVAIAVTTLGLALMLPGGRDLRVLVVGAAAMCLLGLLDDLVRLRPYTKTVGQVAIAAFFVFFGYRLLWTTSLTLDTVLTMLWIVGLTNSLNLLDNMDGLCGGIAVIGGTSLVLSMIVGTGTISVSASYLVILLGAVVGFLVYNIHPASIFMGDSGSLFLGLNLAILTLNSPYETNASTNLLSILVGPLLLVFVPILDTTLVTLSRLFSGRSPAQGGRDHSSHRLVAIGLSERAAVAVLWSLAALGGLLAVAVRGLDTSWTSLAVAVFVLAMIIFAVYLAQVRVYDETDVALKSSRVTPVFLNFVYRRRVAEVILDLCLSATAYYAAYRLRFEGSEFGQSFRSFLGTLPLVMGIQSLALFAVGGYRGVWRQFSLMDGVTFAKGVLLGTLVIVFVIVELLRFQDQSHTVFIIYAALMLLALIGSRGSFRTISELAHRRRHIGDRLVIYGAGTGGASAARELLTSERRYRMIGFVDDDPRMRQARIQGYFVIGDYNLLQTLIKNGGVDAVVISTHLLDVDRLEQLRTLCAEHQVELSRFQYTLEQVVAVS